MNASSRDTRKDRGRCADCGARLYVEPDVEFDVAVHDCVSDEWLLYSLAGPDDSKHPEDNTS